MAHVIPPPAPISCRAKTDKKMRNENECGVPCPALADDC